MLAGVLTNEGAERSAHEALEAAQRQAEDFATLAAEYETLARVGQQQRWDELLDRSGLGADPLEQVRRSPAYGPLLATLRDAEARGFDVERAFPTLVAVRSLEEADDPAAVLHGRVERWVQSAGPTRRVSPNLIAGLIPRAAGVSDPDMVRALSDRDEAMQRRSRELAEHAIEQGKAWVRRLGKPPSDPPARQQWVEAISTVAAYRDRWNLGSDVRPLGSERPVGVTEAGWDLRRAQAALQRAIRLGVEPQRHRAESQHDVTVQIEAEHLIEL